MLGLSQTMPRIHWRVLAVLSVTLFGILLSGQPHLANGVGEIFLLSSSPQRINEGNSTGVALAVSVTNAATSTTYSFTWMVKDPSGTSTVATKSVMSTQPAWALSVKYPVDFTASMNLTGTYSVSVAENLPSVNASIAAGTFQVGLTDRDSYQRTYQARITGSGYLPADNVTILMVKGTTVVPGFPAWKNADTSGRVSFTWQTVPSTPTGTYRVSLAGKNTIPKNPLDLQNFTVVPINVTIASFWTSSGFIQRSQSTDVQFNATYLSGLRVTGGIGQVKLTEPNGTTVHIITATYDNNLNAFFASYQTLLSSSTGAWIAKLEVNSLDDGFGNTGPAISSNAGFNIRTASLTVTLETLNAGYGSGSVIPINARILTPSGGNYTSGSVSATIAYPNGQVGRTIPLVYDMARGRWSGSYKVNSTEPSGTWLVTVSASDVYGNGGNGNTSFNVNIPGSTVTPDTSPFNTGWLPWLVLLLVLGLGFGTLIFRHYGVVGRQVKIDVQAIKQKANEVKSDNFLQSIQAQLKRRADRMQAEQAAAEKEKTD